MVKKFALALGCLLLLCSSALAQFYPTRFRPPVDWQQLQTDHFRIVFPQGYDSTALRTAHILEKEYPKVQIITGGKLSNFPVILTNYNDQSNGVVTSLHFRSEIDIPPIRGKTLNPKTGGWLENVVPHELVHALQFSNTGDFGVGRVMNIFSPDMARSIHGASPSGIQEGLAVYHESKGVTDGGGRGNYPFFVNQFNAVFNSPDRWSMGQMVHFSTDTRPFNRHYIGGYEFTNWLQETYGNNTSRDAIDFHIRWPFLGYGLALKHATGQWPAQLYDEFEDYKQQSLTDIELEYESLPISYTGADIRRPKWLSDSTLIFHGSFYNARSGFYRYNLPDKKIERIVTTESVSDYNYALSDDKQNLIYSYNREDTVYPNASRATLTQTSLVTGESQKIQPDKRLFSPAFHSDSTIIALRSGDKVEHITGINLINHSVNDLSLSERVQLINIAPQPGNSNKLAAVINKDGNQALWITSIDEINQAITEPATLSFSDGSIFDTVWHPSGEKLLFSADFSNTLQVYEYNLSTMEITQLTDAPFNAFEASYSPDGKCIAFIVQRGNERVPVVKKLNDSFAKTIHQGTKRLAKIEDNQLVNSEDWAISEYSTGYSWLKPRTVIPELEELSGSDSQYQYGIGLHSSDLLQQQSYSLELTAAEERLWYDFIYQNKQFFPGFQARVYSEPALRRFRLVTQDQDTLTQSFLRQERSFALSVPMRFNFNQNVEYTSLYAEPEIRQSQFRYFNQDVDAKSKFSNPTIGNIFTQFSYLLQQNVRDVQPNSGIVLYSELEHYFTSDSLAIAAGDGNATLNFNQPTGLRGGLYGYISPLRRWNQSLRVGLQGITQTDAVFDNQSIVSNGFKNNIFTNSNNLMSVNTRYTIPLVYPDNGGLLLPLYLSNIYLVGFTDTVTDPTSENIIHASRTVFGGGIRMRFRISNLSFDIGAGISVEPSRNKMHYFIGNF